MATASTVLAVHGQVASATIFGLAHTPHSNILRAQALAWVPFLASEYRKTAVIEIVLNNERKRFNECYRIWCGTMGVRYFRVAGQLTAGCTGGATNRDNEARRHSKLLRCNVTVDVSQTVAATVAAAKMTQRA